MEKLFDDVGHEQLKVKVYDEVCVIMREGYNVGGIDVCWWYYKMEMDDVYVDKVVVVEVVVDLNIGFYKYCQWY